MFFLATVVKSKKDESKDSLIRRFKKRVLIDQIIPMVRKKEYHIKPSQVRKEQKKERERKLKRERRLQRVLGS